MYHFIGRCIYNGIVYYRVFDSVTKSANDLTREMIINELMANDHIPIRNIGINKLGDLVGTCGNFQNYGMCSYDNKQFKNAYVIVFKRDNKYILVDMNARLYTVNTLEAIVLNESVGIANAKVVTRNGKSYICAINGTFETDTKTDAIGEKRNKFLSMDDANKLSKVNKKRLDKASREFDLREKGYRESIRGKIGPNLSDIVFMMPVTSNLDSIERSSEVSLINAKKKIINSRIKRVNQGLKLLVKRGCDKAEIKGYKDRLRLIFNDIETYEYKLECCDNNNSTNNINMLDNIKFRLDLLYEDIIYGYENIMRIDKGEIKNALS